MGLEEIDCSAIPTVTGALECLRNGSFVSQRRCMGGGLEIVSEDGSVESELNDEVFSSLKTNGFLTYCGERRDDHIVHNVYSISETGIDHLNSAAQI